MLTLDLTSVNFQFILSALGLQVIWPARDHTRNKYLNYFLIFDVPG